MLNWLFGRPKVETRSAVITGLTAEIMAARSSYVAGRSGLGELTATVQACVSLWENGLAISDVDGAEELLTRRIMAIAARQLALRGEALFLIREASLVPAIDWTLSTRDGVPVAYRATIPEAGGGRSETVLAQEVLHFRIGSDATAPYAGSSPLRRASLSAGLLNTIEGALSEVFSEMPFGSQIVPFPESGEVTLEHIGRGFRGKRGRVLLRESVNVSAAGGPAPNADWRPQDVTPNLQQAQPIETLNTARDSVLSVYGVLPALFTQAAQGPLVREAQRHLAQWVLQPIANIMAEEAAEKLGTEVTIDVMRPTQAFDAGSRARSFGALISALAQAKEAGLDPGAAMKALNWDADDDG